MLTGARLSYSSLFTRWLFCRSVSTKLFVGGLSYDTNETVLKKAFDEFGDIIEVKVICDHVSGKSKGYGFLQFDSQNAANNALKKMNDKGTSEIEKAYRRSALKHHPDKAGQSLASENGDDGLWKEIAEEVYKDADKLFKMIAEAHAVLSDPSKRSQYDIEEEMRNSHNFGRNSPRTHADSQNYRYERSAGRWQDGGRSYKSSESRGPEWSRSRSIWHP